MSDFGVGGREDTVGSRELSGMNALLSVEPHRARDAARALEADNVGVVRVRPINGAQTVRARSRDDRVHRSVPSMAWIQGIVLIECADARGRHSHRRRVVPSAEDERLETTRCLRDLAYPDEAGGRFDLRLDSDASSEVLPKLDLCEQRVDELHVRGRADLRGHDEIEAFANRFDDLDDIP